MKLIIGLAAAYLRVGNGNYTGQCSGSEERACLHREVPSSWR